MRRILLTVQYLGKNYNGFQLQKNNKFITVQGQIEAALKQIFKKEVKVVTSGRLDSGVNALALKMHFDITSNIEFKKIIGAINNYLPSDIRVIKTQEVDESFHARYNVKDKTYRYTMYVNRHELPILERDAKRLYKQPNVRLMKKAARYLTGKHDFKAFMSKNSSVKTTTRTIKHLKIKQNKNIITIDVCGNGFLYNMVRIIVGTLLDVGYSKIKPGEVKQILLNKKRQNAGKMVEAKGLCLVNVRY